jgi:HK97 family phage major capsid protein
MSKTSEILDRQKELKTALRERVAANEEVVNASKVEDGTIIVSEDQRKAFDSNMAAIKEIRGTLADLDMLTDSEKYLSRSEGDSVAAEQAASGAGRDPLAGKSLGQAVLESSEFKALEGGRNGYTMHNAFEVKRADIAGMWTKDLYAGTPGDVGDFTAQAVQRDAMVQRQRRTSRVRDLFPVQSTSAATIEFFQVVGFSNNASTVPQRNADNSAFGIKPQSELSFSSQQVSVRTIAHWEAAHRNVLADEPQLRGIIDNELLYGLRLTEDAQILAGSGQGEDLQGILNTPGIQSYNWSDGATSPVADTKADSIRRAATLAFLSYYEPTGVVVHPNDWEDIELTKNTQGDYLLAVSIALGGEPRVWRMPVVDSPAIPEGTALLGSFGIGAQLYDREQANIRVAEQHADFFIRNAVVVLAEERLALAVKRPESFVEINFDGAPS